MFLCTICLEPFKVKRNMLRHVKSQHERVKFTCNVCLKTYTRKYNLIKHVKDVHSNNDVQPRSPTTRPEPPTPLAENDNMDLWGDEEEYIQLQNELEKTGKTLHS